MQALPLPSGGAPAPEQPAQAPPATNGMNASSASAPVANGMDASNEMAPPTIRSRVRAVLDRHGRKLWWLHSLYAAALGAGVVAFAERGLERARWLVVSLGLAWILVVAFFRSFGSGARAQNFVTARPDGRIRFFVVTYVLKNLYQGMLFFLLPFYWKSATLDAPNRWFFAALAACALLSTLDLVFDRVLMRWKAIASVFYAFAQFACLNLVIPALLPSTRSLFTLLAAAALTAIGFFTIHVPLASLRERRTAIALAAGVVLSTAGAYAARGAIPPVPMHVASAAVGPSLLADGRLAMEVRSMHARAAAQIVAVTDVVVPAGKGDTLRHVWRREGTLVASFHEGSGDGDVRAEPLPGGAVRLRSTLPAARFASRGAGVWSVDVETEDGRLVGRTSFVITE